MDKPILEHLPTRKFKYDDYINQVKDNAIMINKTTMVACVDPDFKHRLTELMLSPKFCEEELTWDDVLTVLKLEVEYWNKTNSKLYVFLSSISAALTNEMAQKVVEEIAIQKIEERKVKEKAEDMLKKYEVS